MVYVYKYDLFIGVQVFEIISDVNKLHQNNYSHNNKIRMSINYTKTTDITTTFIVK